MIRYRRRRPDDADLRERLRDLAGARRRFGYRRLHVLLRQEGWTVNRKKTQRLYREEGLSVRRRRGRKRAKRATGTRAPILTAATPNARWSVDFVHDQLVTGCRLRILNVVDDVTKECLAAIVDTSISGKRVARELNALVAMRGKPELIVSDHGTEFTSNAMLAWTEAAGVSTSEQKPASGRRKSRPLGDERLGARALQIAGACRGASARQGRPRGAGVRLLPSALGSGSG